MARLSAAHRPPANEERQRRATNEETRPADLADAGADHVIRVARGDDGQACAHGWHLYDIEVDDVLEFLPAGLDELSAPADQDLDDLLPEHVLPAHCLEELEDQEAEPATLSGPEILARWQCPRAASGFARAALDYLGATVR
ncbi:hypothetical protein ACH41E_16120 [Streptomyces sp. NPDC020412]|uniref:hypothetical protein n=1 Tax=Streptomyces sp. NPDC020412 TaxID=3365073 RepID=UPI0037B0AF4E